MPEPTGIELVPQGSGLGLESDDEGTKDAGNSDAAAESSNDEAENGDDEAEGSNDGAAKVHEADEDEDDISSEEE
jgi:hypothetical protein